MGKEGELQDTLKNRTIFCKDNLEVLRGINSNSIDLVYLDPPFNKKRVFTAPIGTSAKGAAFSDIFKEKDTKAEEIDLIKEKNESLYNFLIAVGKISSSYNKCYLFFMAIRLLEMYRVIKDTGSLYLHCDPTMSHYLKLLLDIIFGEKNFKNEVIWGYKSGGVSKRYFAKKHDTILCYVKDSNKAFFNPLKEKSYNRNFKPYRFKGVKEYEDKDGRWYTQVNMKDVWHIDMIGRTSKERTGYPTQKPIKLLERIVESSSREGDLVLDPFCGCATTCVAAEKLRRKWIGIDVSKKTLELVKDRLKKEMPPDLLDILLDEPWKKVHARTDIPLRTDFFAVKRPVGDIRQDLYGKQKRNCEGCKIHFHFGNLTIDHIVPKAKGGGDDENNLQLLCHRCNCIKGNREMSYLKIRLGELEAFPERKNEDYNVRC